MLVVPGEGEPWRRTVDLRVEDSPDPLKELRRLLTLQRAYDLAGAGDELLAAGRTDEAGELYTQAAALAPDSDELLFWAGLARAQAGDLDAGVAAVKRAAEVNPDWLTLLARLSPEFAPAGEAVRQALSRSPERGTSHASGRGGRGAVVAPVDRRPGSAGRRRRRRPA